MSIFRTRQAPSPTGYLHLGTARQMLFTKLFAACNEGTWFLRIEDTDRSRLQPESVKNLLQAINGLGLTPDEGVTLEKTETYNDFYDIYQRGEYGPYIQSERLEYYHEAAQKLLDKKKAYWSYLTPEEKQELQNFKKITKAPLNYLQANQEKYPDKDLYASVKEVLAGPDAPALLFAVQREETISCYDELLGKSEFNLALEEDFVILKSDGFPTYHLAFAVDDHLMQTSLVIRAQEWFPSFPKHVTIFQELWGQEALPKFIHLPVILGQTGNKKMSKRDGNVNMSDYLDQGYLGVALVNYLCFLGWNPGTERERYLSDEEINSLSSRMWVPTLIANVKPEFTLQTISTSSARYNLDKLQWFNREYLKAQEAGTFYRTVKEYLSYLEGTGKEDSQDETKTTLSQIQTRIGSLEALDPDLVKLAFKLDQNRITTLSEIGSESKCILNWKVPGEEIKWRKITLEESRQNLREVGEFIQTVWSDVTLPANTEPLSYITEAAAVWEKTIKDWLQAEKRDTGSYLWPLRVALSGETRSPSPFEILSILSLEEIERRISASLNK